MIERNRSRIQGCDPNNLIKAANPCGRVEYFNSEFQWKELGQKWELKEFTKGSTLQGVQG
jgi:hypothetical protein